MRVGNAHTKDEMMLRKWDEVRKRRAFARRPVSMTAKICTSDGNPEPWRMANPWGNGLANSPQFTAGIAFGKEVTVNAKGRGRSVGLGKPNRGAIVTAECTYSLDVVDGSGTTGLQCEDTLLMGSFDIDRTGKKPFRENITDVFRATGCLDVNTDGTCNAGDLAFSNLWIFNIPQLTEYFWDYDNNGLKLMQVRFYETTSGSIGTVK